MVLKTEKYIKKKDKNNNNNNKVYNSIVFLIKTWKRNERNHLHKNKIKIKKKIEDKKIKNLVKIT